MQSLPMFIDIGPLPNLAVRGLFGLFGAWQVGGYKGKFADED